MFLAGRIEQGACLGILRRLLQHLLQDFDRSLKVLLLDIGLCIRQLH